MPDKRDGRPRHQQVAADLRARIMACELTAGAQLPSTQQLVDHYGVANATVQRALGALKAEGFLSSRVGKGVYVRDHLPSVVDVGTYFTPAPKGYSYRLLDVRDVSPPAEVARALNSPVDSPVVLRHRTMLLDGEPVELSWSYYPLEIAADSPLAGRVKIAGGAPKALADLGFPQREFTDQLSARLPTTEELEALELPNDVPVLRQFRVVYSDDHRPVEVSILIKGAHRYELRYHQDIPS